MTITKFYTVIEVHINFKTNKFLIDTESFKTRTEAKQAIKENFNDRLNTLTEAHHRIKLQSNQNNEFADIETNNVHVHWEIQLQMIVD